MSHRLTDLPSLFHPQLALPCVFPGNSFVEETGLKVLHRLCTSYRLGAGSGHSVRLRLDFFFWQDLLIESSVFLSQEALSPAGSGARAAADGQ